MEISLKRPVFTKFCRPSFLDYEYEYKVLIDANKLQSGYNILKELKELPEDVLKRAYIDSEGDLCLPSSFGENLITFKKAMEDYNIALKQYVWEIRSYNDKINLLVDMSMLTKGEAERYLVDNSLYYINVEQEIERIKHERLV